MPTNTTDRFDNKRRYRGNGHDAQRQLTPAYVLAPIRTALGGSIGLDPCTEQDNPTGADGFFTAFDDGLGLPWFGRDWLPTIYCNPPYSEARKPWVRRCVDAGARGQKVVLLIPSHTDTRIWHEAYETANAVCFIKGRVKFGILRANRRQEAASHPSALLAWNCDLSECVGIGAVTLLRPVPLRPLSSVRGEDLTDPRLG